MAAKYMLGPEGVANAVVTRLQTALPGRISSMRARYNVTREELPDIVAVFPVEQDMRSIEQFPCMFVIETETDGRVSNQQTDGDAFEDEYFFRYRMRVFIWAVGEDTAYVGTAIRRYILAVREILLHNKLLHDTPGNHAALDPQTVKESIGDMAQDDAGMRLGMAYVEFEVMTQETLTTWTPGDVPNAQIVQDIRVVPTMPPGFELDIDVHPEPLGQ